MKTQYFRKKPIIIQAHQWFRNGDHPNDECVLRPDGQWSEGKIVRFYRVPEEWGSPNCQHCGKNKIYHGWIDTLEGGHIVCPGDWIITGYHGEYYPCKPNIFEQTYEPVEEQ